MKWIRLWTQETFQSTTFQELNLVQRGVWFSLLIMAGGNVRNPGLVEVRDGVAYSLGTLAELIACDEKELQIALDRLIEVNKVIMLPDHRIQITNWERYQTRYEKYYKDGINSGISNGIKYGMELPDRLDVDKKEIRRRKEEDKKKKKKDILPTGKSRRDPDLQSLISYASGIGFGLQGSQQSNRRYAYNLLRKKGANDERLGLTVCCELVDAAVACRGQAYAPQINDFKALFYKFQDLVGYVRKQQTGGRIG